MVEPTESACNSKDYKISPSIVEPYNTVLSVHGAMDYEDLSFTFNNTALYNICINDMNMMHPKYIDLNAIIVQMIAAETSKIRFPDDINSDLDSIQKNLVPFSRTHFTFLSYAPLINQRKVSFYPLTIEELTLECYESGNQTIVCDPVRGVYLSCTILYRGKCSPTDVNNIIQRIKASNYIKLPLWSPTRLKASINDTPPIYTPRGNFARSEKAISMVSNNSVIKDMWHTLIKKFDLMYEKRAFIHHYFTEGIGYDDFSNARDNVLALEEDYMELEK